MKMIPEKTPDKEHNQSVNQIVCPNQDQGQKIIIGIVDPVEISINKSEEHIEKCQPSQIGTEKQIHQKTGKKACQHPFFLPPHYSNG
jgi:ribosomal protein L13